MFDEQNKTSGVEDILAATEGAPSAVEVPLGPPSALAGGKLQPVQPGASSSVMPSEQMSNAGHSRFPLKKIIALAIVVLVVGGAATAGYWWWQTHRSQTAEPSVPLGQPGNEGALPAPPATENNEPAPNVLNQALDQFQQNSINKALDPLATPPATSQSNIPAAPGAPAVDTDLDGLNDADELAQGTNPRLVDSDGDSLSDWEEVTVFGTKPLNSDSDGDGYQDGSEVQNGYNPNGPGKLLDFEKAKTQAQ